MTQKPKRLMAAGIVALLLTGVPSGALAESDVVLYNESTDSNVQTGESSFNNSTANESTSATFDPPGSGGGETITSVQTTSSAPVESRSVAPQASKAATPVKTEVASATSKAVDALFVGMSVGSTVGP